ncbi:MAG: AbrB/MazE/SpoVT family DNA-binding domain-containing protein [Rhizobiaceae bacterium]|nr:AbrB/MazE/SpoVT family DNA-binding domain-containing protein [Rhizobiaceae bacterium]MCV0406068.1 AbrB/MazE/SpoVT family DNA-binding domain-containing protein [Rhizobiaceae bacterium]
MRVSKWGNSLAVRLPASLVEKLDLKERRRNQGAGQGRP